ncbi:MAG: translational GTPase TypA [Firmicutes bacterium]|nr:translational GTPase TypA [Bacillota bacterium]
MTAQSIRNVAIIAHVDHGKTTLVDALLKQSGVFRTNQQVAERLLDSNELERERGITILAKNTSLSYGGVKVNIVDTPGHADFGGEVERILSMVDGALLVVDAGEGPMPQTRFVLNKALDHRLKIILVVNKIDRVDARPAEVVDKVLDLFISLGAGEEQIDFPVVYTDARRGIATLDPDLAAAYSGLARTGGTPALEEGIRPVLDEILRSIPAPKVAAGGQLQMMVSTLTRDDYLGRIAIGRITRGTLKRGQGVAVCRLDGSRVKAQIASIHIYHGLKRLEIDEAVAGDIVAVAGLDDVAIGETVADPDYPDPLPPIRVDEPTVMMTFLVNDSPFAGRDGAFVTSRHLRDRLYRESEKDVSLKVQDMGSADAFLVSGRGELHLSILMETMRREGYEMAVSKPKVIFREDKGQTLEPFEYLSVDVPEEYVGAVMEEAGPRKGEMVDMRGSGQGRVRLDFSIPTRGLMGFRPAFLTATRGTGVMTYSFDGYRPHRGAIDTRRQGSMIAWETGVTTTYALHNAQERGTLFLGPGEEVYAGQVVGEHCRPRDLDINVCKKKHLTNVRSSVSDITLHLTPPRRLSLEESLEWIGDDELVEVTPKAIRLRKVTLDRHERYRQRGTVVEEPETD